MEKEMIRNLCKGYLEGSLTSEQLHQFIRYIRSSPDHQLLLEEMKEALDTEQYPSLADKTRASAMFERIMKEGQMPAVVNIKTPSTENRPKVFVIRNLRWVAAVLLILAGASYLYTRKEIPVSVATIPQKPSIQQSVAPGGLRATLTLGNGSVILLDSAANGELAQQGAVRVMKLTNGQLSYSGSGQTGSEVMYNTMSTPRGGQYQLLLPDGSRVWLNAASSITYPTVFTGKERKVTISGEAYLEVAKNAAAPFKIIVPDPGKSGSTDNDMEIEVLGTDFNINAYPDEEIAKTTLLAGSVRVRRGQSGGILKPGQQAQLPVSGSLRVINNADMAEAVAWKNGFFQFNKADLAMVMRQLARWYDVQVQYEGNIPDQLFKGKIQQDLALAEVLEGLQQTQVHFRIEGKKLIVMP